MLVIVAWAFIMPILFIMGLLSVYFLWLWAIPIIIVHYKDLLCEVKRGGYKRKPLLQPVAKTVCKIFNYTVGSFTENVTCDNEENVLKKICGWVEIIPEILWILIVTPFLYVTQSFFLYIALWLKVLSIANIITFSYYWAKKADEDGPVFILPGVTSIGGVWWEETEISLRMPWMKSATNTWWLPIKEYIPSPEKWSDHAMEVADWITCVDPNVWIVQLAFFVIPTNFIAKTFDFETLVQLKKPTKCDPAWIWDPNILNRYIKTGIPPFRKPSMGKYRRLKEGEEPKAYGRF